jgi:hypothetical protein
MAPPLPCKLQCDVKLRIHRGRHGRAIEVSAC